MTAEVVSSLAFEEDLLPGLETLAAAAAFEEDPPPVSPAEDPAPSLCFTTLLAETVKTPSNHSRVSWFMWPNSCCLGIDFGFITEMFISFFIRRYACAKTRQIVDFPHPDGPTIPTPILC